MTARQEGKSCPARGRRPSPMPRSVDRSTWSPIAIYAAISKELGLPLRFPGKPESYRAIFKVAGTRQTLTTRIWPAG